MKHYTYKKRLPLLLYGELDPAERQALQEHLQTCSECQSEFALLQRLFETASPRDAEVDDTLLREARRQLHSTLRREPLRRGFWQHVMDSLPIFTFPGYRIALGGAAAIVFGIVLGRLSMTSQGPQESSMRQPEVASAVPVEGTTRITNVRFINSGGGGEIEFTFDAVTPVRMKGSVDDPHIQKVLTHAMLNEENPGVRIRAVSALSEQKIEPADRKVKGTLILALRNDANAAVRKEALAALRRFPFDDEIKDALLHTLMYDKNPGLRIAAINGLDSSGIAARGSQDVLNVLKNRADSDDNNYIRLRAKATLQEVQSQ